MDGFIGVEPYTLRGIPGQRCVIRHQPHGEPDAVLMPDWEALDKNTTLDSVAAWAAQWYGLPVNHWPYDKPVQP